MAALLLAPLTTATAGCYSGDWTYQTVRSPPSSSQVPYGSTLQVTGPEANGGTPVVRVVEQPSCRTALRGDEIQVGHRIATQNMWPMVIGVLGLSAAASMGIGAAAVQQSDSDTASGLAGGAVFSALVGAAFFIPWLAMPSSRTSEKQQTTGRYAEWASPPQPCGTASPVRATMPLRFDVVSDGAAVATWNVSTQPDGQYVDTQGLFEAGRRIGPWCSTPKLVIWDTLPAAVTETDSPDAPRAATKRNGEPLVLDIPSAGTRQSLEEIGRIDPNGAAVARRCCQAQTTRDFAEACVERCIRAAAAANCANGRRACESTARGSEFADEGLALCNKLLSSCLAAHGSGTAQLEVCKSMCTSDKVTEVCR